MLNAGARFGAGDVFFTISVSHWSAFGSGVMVSMGTTFCGDVGGDEIVVLAEDKAVAGDGVRGKVSAMLLLKTEELFTDETATRLLNLDGIIGASSTIDS